MRNHKHDVEERGDGLASLEEARRATIAADRLKDVRDFWPGFAAAVRRERGDGPDKTGARPEWRWILGTAGLLALPGTTSGASTGLSGSSRHPVAWGSWRSTEDSKPWRHPVMF